MATSTTGEGPDKGRRGDITYYQRNGQVISRMAHNNRVRKGRTRASMANRTKMSNVIGTWQLVGRLLEECFEKERPGQTAYSMFRSLNLGRTEVHLTKVEAEHNARVADHFVVSHGSLPQPVQVEERDGLMLSDLRVENLPQGEDSTMMALVAELGRCNPGRVEQGDELLFLRLRQEVSLNTHWPEVEAQPTRLTLDPFDRRTLRGVMQSQFFGDGFLLREGRLCAPAREGDLVAWIHLRPRRKGRPLVTTQQLVGRNPLLERYTSQEQLEAAILSYGPLEG